MIQQETTITQELDYIKISKNSKSYTFDLKMLTLDVPKIQAKLEELQAMLKTMKAKEEILIGQED